ncbi:integrase [Streptomyces sp. NPDC102384]|uniref:integrase n=1 Tax=Streptomyces sp. NPDC102384 TaxID=3366166 RepID=UPI0037FDF4E3
MATKQIVGRNGAVLQVAEARAKDARTSNVHWLTPRTWRTWIDVGLRGFGPEGVPESGWAGRLEDRNAAMVRLLTSSGLRRSEGGSLLTFEVPVRGVAEGRYCRGRIAAEVTRSKKARTFYVASETVGDIETYVASSRVWVIRKAQRTGRYERLPQMRLVTEVTRGLRPMVHWRTMQGVRGVRALDRLSVWERRLMFTEGPYGPEPLWLWLNEQGLPFAPHSWDGVFRTANERCARVLTPPDRHGWDPHRVFAPYATPHSARNSFALYMLVVLNCLMDQRYGLTPQERRDFRLLYGDPWFMVQNLLGHASRETTVSRYLAPVADLQLRSLLATADDEVERAPMPQLDEVFARVARESEGIQDLEAQLVPGAGGTW